MNPSFVRSNFRFLFVCLFVCLCVCFFSLLWCFPMVWHARVGRSSFLSTWKNALIFFPTIPCALLAIILIFSVLFVCFVFLFFCFSFAERQFVFFKRPGSWPRREGLPPGRVPGSRYRPAGALHQVQRALHLPQDLHGLLQPGTWRFVNPFRTAVSFWGQFGTNYLGIWLVCPQNGTGVLKGLKQKTKKTAGSTHPHPITRQRSRSAPPLPNQITSFYPFFFFFFFFVNKRKALRKKSRIGKIVLRGIPLPLEKPHASDHSLCPINKVVREWRGFATIVCFRGVLTFGKVMSDQCWKIVLHIVWWQRK